jgi:3-oxoacyl-[acyl-carrier-protein] synthase-3
MGNDDFVATLDTSDEWIRERTGIRERRIAAAAETSVSLGLEASRRALAAANLPIDEIDLIICATVTPDMQVPSAACMIHAGLGGPPIPAFDLNAACSGFLYGMSTAYHYIRGGAARNVLLVGADVMSRIVDYSDRNTCILFGDGAGAVILSASNVMDRGFRYFRLYADGNQGHLIRLNSVTHRAGESSPEDAAYDLIRMNGREVFKFAVRKICELMREAMLECELTPADIDLVVPHQVNQRILDAAFDNLGISTSKLMVNLERYGNTSAGSVPIAFDEAVRTGRAKPGDTVLLMAFGGGMTWSSAVLTL